MLETIKNTFINIDLYAILDVIKNYSFKLLFAILILTIGKLISNYITKITLSYLNRVKNLEDNTLHIKFIAHTFGIIVMVISGVFSLHILGISNVTIATILGTAGLAIGLSLKDSLSNISSGLIILGLKMFKDRDLIEISGISGYVEETNLLCTIIRTTDNKQVFIPNTTITNNLVTNINKLKIRKIELTYQIDYNDEVEKAREIILNTANSSEYVLKTPNYECNLTNLNNNGIELTLSFWVKTEQVSIAKSQLNQYIILKFKEQNITIPSPQLTIKNPKF